MLSVLKANFLKVALACTSMVACSVVDDVLPKDDKTIKKPTAKTEPSPTVIHLDVPTPVSSARLLA